MNGFIHPGHWAAVQHYDQVAKDFRTAERYETDRMLRIADETVRAERKAHRRAQRAEWWAQRRHLIRSRLQQALRLSM